MKDSVVKLWIARSHVASLVAMVESYEALGVVRITDSKKALAEIYASPHFLEDLLSLLKDLTLEGIAINILGIRK